MRGRVALVSFLAAAAVLGASAASETAPEGARASVDTLGREQARAAAEAFGRALVRAETALLRPILPERGKVRMRVSCFGPEDGSYGGGQVEALLRDFLREGALRSFEILRVESDPRRYALVQARARAIDRGGRAIELELHLTFEPENTRWVLREVRETPP